MYFTLPPEIKEKVEIAAKQCNMTYDQLKCRIWLEAEQDDWHNDIRFLLESHYNVDSESLSEEQIESIVNNVDDSYDRGHDYWDHLCEAIETTLKIYKF